MSNEKFFHAARNHGGAVTRKVAQKDWERALRNNEDLTLEYAGFYYEGDYGNRVYVRCDENGQPTE